MMEKHGKIVKIIVKFAAKFPNFSENAKTIKMGVLKILNSCDFRNYSRNAILADLSFFSRKTLEFDDRTGLNAVRTA